MEIEEQTGGNVKGALEEVINQLIKDAENVVEDVSEEVRQELTDEIAIIRDQFEKKKKQIMEKARKNTNNKTSMITDKIKEALAKKIDQMSTSKITEAFEYANHQLEDLVKLSTDLSPKAIKELSADEKPEGQNSTPRANGKQVVESNKKDEIEISAIEVDDNTKSRTNFEDWITR